MIDALYVTLILDPSDASDASRHPRCVERPALCEARKVGPVSILPASQLGEGPRHAALGAPRTAAIAARWQSADGLGSDSRPPQPGR
jgi:hypothetical protein